MNSRSTYNQKEITQISVSATNRMTAGRNHLRGGPTGPVSELLDNRFLLSFVPWKGASYTRRLWNRLQVWSSTHESMNKQDMLL